jgi:hypothetical protein
MAQIEDDIFFSNEQILEHIKGGRIALEYALFQILLNTTQMNIPVEADIKKLKTLLKKYNNAVTPFEFAASAACAAATKNKEKKN